MVITPDSHVPRAFPEPTPEELLERYRRHELDHGRKPKVQLTPKQKAKRERARANRKKKR